MPSSHHDWNARYRSPDKSLHEKPAAILAEVRPLLPSGLALDLACGHGPNSLFLASHGWDVTAIDFSSAALELARNTAQSAGIRVNAQKSFALLPPKPRSLRLIEADLEMISLPVRQFDLIVCFSYLQRSLFPAIEDALRPCGVLLYETFTRENLRFSGGPRNPDFLLSPGELRAAFPSLAILFYRELSAGKGIATLLARKSS